MSARVVLLAGIALSALSCAGDGVVSMVGPPPSDAPTLTELQTTIFTPHCGIPGCHAGPVPEQRMDLSAGQTYASTVGVASRELSGFKRILPNNAADSYLYMKIAGDPRIVGVRMPFFATPLTADQLEAVRLWIEAGALDN